jgi:hypothetical protein
MRIMANTRNRLPPEPESKDYKSIGMVAPLDLYLVGNVTDGEGKTQPSRVVLRIRGQKKFYFPFAPGTEQSMKTASPWMQKALEDAIDGRQGEAGPDDLSNAVPTGSPT